MKNFSEIKFQKKFYKKHFLEKKICEQIFQKTNSRKFFLLKKFFPEKIYFISIVGIIILNFTNHLSIMHTYKSCIDFSIIQQFFIFTACYSCLQLICSFLQPLTASYNPLHFLTTYSYILQLNRAWHSPMKIDGCNFRISLRSLRERERRWLN